MASEDVLARRNARAAQLSGGKPSAIRAKINVLPPDPKVITWAVPQLKTWYLLNTDTQETLFGQFEVNDLQEQVSSSYANTFALNRQRAIKQFLHGNVETFQFTTRFYALFALQPIQERVEQLKNWCRRDPQLGRPPILYFWVGNQHARMKSCVLTSVSVAYDRPGFIGTMQGADVSVQLEQYDPFSLTETATFDTLYHFAKLGDTYELLAAKHYGNALLGAELRDRHPKQRRLKPGDRVKLPAPTGSIRRTVVAPKSIALQGILDRRNNPQKTNLARVRAARNSQSISYKVL